MRRTLFCALLGASCWAQNQATVFRSDSNLVTVSFQVEDTRDRTLVRNLGADEIQILEDGRPQAIAWFEGARSRTSIPVELGLLFDCSGSTWQSAVMNTFRFDPGLLRERENVRIAIYAFSRQVRRLVKATADIDVLNSSILQLQRVPRQGSPIYESIRETAEDMMSGRAGAVRQMIIFSDGETPFSQANVDRTVQVANERNIRLYPVLLHNPLSEPKDGSHRGHGARGPLLPPVKPALDQQHGAFLRLAGETGGAEYLRLSPGSDVINDVLKNVMIELEATYVAGYYPKPDGGQRPHSVQVRLVSGSRGKLRGGARKIVY